MALKLLYVVGSLVSLFTCGSAQEDLFGLWMLLGGPTRPVLYGQQLLPPTPQTPISSSMPPRMPSRIFRPPPLPSHITSNTSKAQTKLAVNPSAMQTSRDVTYNGLSADGGIVRLPSGIAMPADDYRLLDAAVKFIVGPNASPDEAIIQVVMKHRGVPQTLQQMLEYVPVLDALNRRTHPPVGSRRPTPSDILLRALRYYSIQQRTMGVGTGRVLF